MLGFAGMKAKRFRRYCGIGRAQGYYFGIMYKCVQKLHMNVYGIKFVPYYQIFI